MAGVQAQVLKRRLQVEENQITRTFLACLIQRIEDPIQIVERNADKRRVNDGDVTLLSQRPEPGQFLFDGFAVSGHGVGHAHQHHRGQSAPGTGLLTPPEPLAALHHNLLYIVGHLIGML